MICVYNIHIHYVGIWTHNSDIILLFRGSYCLHNANQYMHIKAEHIISRYVDVIVKDIM